MAQTIFEGQLVSIKRHPEANPNFAANEVWEPLIAILGSAVTKKDDDELWICGNDAWLRINRNGTIEIGQPAA